MKEKKKHYPRLLRFRVKKDHIHNFLESLAMQVDAGLDLFSALQSIEKDTPAGVLKVYIARLSEDVDDGNSLWKAFENSHSMPAYVVSLTRIGEEAGTLPENLNAIVKQQNKDNEFRSRVRSAMLYPVFVLILAAVLAVGIASFILPNLSNVFSRLNIELPLMTQWLISAGLFFDAYGAVVIPAGIIVIIFSFFFTFLFGPTKFIGQWMLFHTPGIHKLIQQIEVGRMGYVLGTLLHAGLPIVEAINSLADTTTFRMYQKLYRTFAHSIDEGHSFQETFAEVRKTRKLLPATIQQMVAAGERSGKLADILKKVGLRYEAKTENTTKNLSVILEPILLVVVWLGVVFVALAIILPVYSLVGQLNT